MMPWMSRAALAFVAVAIGGVAHADPLEVGAFLGPRIFSQSSALGYIDDAPAHPMLQTSVAFGGRIGHEFFVPWFFPEIELGFSPTHTNAVDGAKEVTAYWLDPRIQLRFELRPGYDKRVQPFVYVGAGAPTVFSTARMTLDTGIIAEGYGGVGVRLDTLKGFRVRVDAKVSVITGSNPPPVGVEAEFDFGIDFGIGGPKRPSTTEVTPVQTADLDTDGDGIPDSKDKCPTRPEDFDGFEDADGCPDIDNDGDHVLDIADKCPMQPETYNGFEDDDGCPDTVPADVSGIVGSIEGLLYAEGETAVRDSAQASIKKVAKVLADHPGVKVVLIGHTDDREAKAFATPPAEGQPPPDIEALATELAHGRAEAVKQALVAAGVPEGRIVVDGVGAEDPVADNNTPKGRLANRRVELKLFVAHY
jgi:OmpA-OmpF porin, OOP family